MYIPSKPPERVEDLQVWLDQELLRISTEFSMISDGLNPVLSKPPRRVYPGMLVIADGTNWNPGNGEGLYRRTSSGTWKYIG